MSVHAISDFELARLKNSLLVISDGAWNGPCNISPMQSPSLMLGRLVLQVSSFDTLKMYLNGVEFTGNYDSDDTYLRLPRWFLESAVVSPRLGIAPSRITLDGGQVSCVPLGRGTRLNVCLNWYDGADEKVQWDKARAAVAQRVQLCGAYWVERDINQMLHLLNNLIEELIRGMDEYRELKSTRDRNVNLNLHTHALVDLLSVREYRLKDLAGNIHGDMKDTLISSALDHFEMPGQVMPIAYYSVRDALAWLLLEVKSLRHHYRGMSEQTFPNSLLLQLMLEDLVWIWDGGEPYSGYWANLIES